MSIAIAEPETGNTTLMSVTLTAVLAILRFFTSQHYILGAVTVCYRFAIG